MRRSTGAMIAGVAFLTTAIGISYMVKDTAYQRLVSQAERDMRTPVIQMHIGEYANKKDVLDPIEAVVSGVRYSNDQHFRKRAEDLYSEGNLDPEMLCFMQKGAKLYNEGSYDAISLFVNQNNLRNPESKKKCIDDKI